MRDRARKFLKLRPVERGLFCEALAHLAAARLALWRLPFRSWRNLYCGPLPPRTAPTDHPARRIAWSIAAASALVPRATCLVKALAARRLLARHGHEADIRIGVTNHPSFQAHAWLESNGEILLGGYQSGTYTALEMERTP